MTCLSPHWFVVALVLDAWTAATIGFVAAALFARGQP
jgi:hypothetical protein